MMACNGFRYATIFFFFVLSFQSMNKRKEESGSNTLGWKSQQIQRLYDKLSKAINCPPPPKRWSCSLHPFQVNKCVKIKQVKKKRWKKDNEQDASKWQSLPQVMSVFVEWSGHEQDQDVKAHTEYIQWTTLKVQRVCGMFALKACRHRRTEVARRQKTASETKTQLHVQQNNSERLRSAIWHVSEEAAWLWHWQRLQIYCLHILLFLS